MGDISYRYSTYYCFLCIVKLLLNWQEVLRVIAKIYKSQGWGRRGCCYYTSPKGIYILWLQKEYPFRFIPGLLSLRKWRIIGGKRFHCTMNGINFSFYFHMLTVSNAKYIDWLWDYIRMKSQWIKTTNDIQQSLKNSYIRSLI